MGSTLIEKIFAHNIGAASVKAGDIITAMQKLNGVLTD